jgi:hypothetical protein
MRGDATKYIVMGVFFIIALLIVLNAIGLGSYGLDDLDIDFSLLVSGIVMVSVIFIMMTMMK